MHGRILYKVSDETTNLTDPAYLEAAYTCITIRIVKIFNESKAIAVLRLPPEGHYYVGPSLGTFNLLSCYV